MSRRPGSITAGDISARVIRGPREDGRWYWRSEHRSGGARVTIWTGWATREEAIRTLSGVVATGETSKPTGDGAETVHDLLEMFVAAVELRGDLAPSTVAMRRGSASRLTADALLGSVRIDRLDARATERHRDQRLRAGDAAMSVRLDLGTLGAAWRWARDVGAVPDRDLRLPKVRVQHVDRFRPTRGEAAAVIAWLRENCMPWVAQIVEVYSVTGCRRGELGALRWRDLRNGILAVDGKTGPRRVPLPPSIAEGLERRRGHDDAGMWGVSAGTVKCDVPGHLRDASAAVGLAGSCSTHAIRRYVIDELRRAGVDVVVAARAMGHSATTAIRSYHSPSEGDIVSAFTRAALDVRPRGKVVKLAHRAGAQGGKNKGRTWRAPVTAQSA